MVENNDFDKASLRYVSQLMASCRQSYLADIVVVNEH